MGANGRAPGLSDVERLTLGMLALSASDFAAARAAVQAVQGDGGSDGLIAVLDWDGVLSVVLRRDADGRWATIWARGELMVGAVFEILASAPELSGRQYYVTLSPEWVYAAAAASTERVTS